MSIEARAFNRQHLSSVIGIHDAAVLTMIYREFLDSLTTFLALLESSLADAEALERELHTMLSSSSAVGAIELAELIHIGEAAVTGHDATAHFDRDGLRQACLRAREAVYATLDALKG